ncbi:MAG: RNA polymerase sigma factor SigJ [Brevibacillus sp.]|nr:RNA polymerase sigma factor SigJ [Brevibacillus sp.]
MLLFTLAYQLTGSATDAEDVVQDVFVKVYDIDRERLKEPKAYLCKMVTNRCLDLLKSARKRREQYFGPWLPEPIRTPDGDSFESVVRSDLLSYAMLVLLEWLSPAERAVFVLREALGFEYPAIAELTGKSVENCRKLMSRARQKMGITEEGPISVESAREEWVRRFLAALEQERVDTILSLLAEDVVLVSDGGGKVTAAAHPVTTRDRVARFLLGLIRKTPHYGGVDMEFTSLNRQTGVIIRSNGVIQAALLMHVKRGSVKNLYIVRNPDKLRHL